MKEELEKQLLQSIDVVKQYITMTTDFVGEQAPLLISEIVRFNLFYSGLWLLFSMITAFITYRCIIGIQKYHKEKDVDKVATCIIGLAISAMTTIIMFFCNIKIFVMCLVAPRLFIINYIKGFYTTTGN